MMSEYKDEYNTDIIPDQQNSVVQIIPYTIQNENDYNPISHKRNLSYLSIIKNHRSTYRRKSQSFYVNYIDSSASVNVFQCKDLLQMILSFLSLHEYILVGRVHSFWYDSINTPNIHVLNIDLVSYRFFITDEILSSLLYRFKNILYLNLASCHQITDKSLETIGQFCQYLEILNIRGLPNITDHGLSFLKNCPFLQTLIIWACPNVTNEGINILSQHLHNEFHTPL